MSDDLVGRRCPTCNNTNSAFFCSDGYHAPHSIDKSAANAIAARDAEITSLQAHIARCTQTQDETIGMQAVKIDRLKALLEEAGKVTERCAIIVDRNLYHQTEKVEDVPKLLRAVLAKLENRDAD